MDTSKFPTWFTVLDHDEALNRVRGKAPLSRFKLDDTEIVGIREPEEYQADDEDLTKLATSLNFNGTLRIDTDPKVVLKPDAEHLTVVGGNRRITAALWLLKQGKLKGDPMVNCILISDEEKNRVAARDNAFRKPLSEMGDYREIILLHGKGMTPEEIGAVKGGIDKRTVERFISISTYPVLEAMLKAKMPYSRLAKIADTLKDKSGTTKTGTMAFLKKWHEEEAPKRRQAKKDEAAKKNKTVNSKSLELGKLLKPGEFEGWIRDMTEDGVPTGKPKTYTVSVETKNDTLKISSSNIDLTKATWDEIGRLLAKYKTQVLPEIKKVMDMLKIKSSMEEDDRDEAELEVLKEMGIVPSDDEGSEEGTAAESDAEPEDDGGFDEDAK